MDNKTKAIGGTSILAVCLLLFHIFHGIETVSKLFDNKDGPVKNANVYIVQTDSSGKRDTIQYKDYLEKHNTIPEKKK